MKKRHYFRLLTLLFCAVLITSACDDDDDDNSGTNPNTNQHEDAFGDVFVKKVKSKNGDQYGLVFYAGGQGLKTCTAKAPDGTQYELAEFWKGEGNMRRHPESNEMKPTMPQMGAYEFTMTFSDGETKTISDNLENVEIPSIKVDTVIHVKGSNTVTAKWKKVDGVGFYMVKLTDKNKNENKPIFNNKRVAPDAVTYTFDNTTTGISPGWMTAEPAEGDTCYVMVVGVKYEASAEPAVYDQNKQMNTVQPKKIIW